jgi:hypothetical protein
MDKAESQSKEKGLEVAWVHSWVPRDVALATAVPAAADTVEYRSRADQADPVWEPRLPPPTLRILYLLPFKTGTLTSVTPKLPSPGSLTPLSWVLRSLNWGLTLENRNIKAPQSSRDAPCPPKEGWEWSFMPAIPALQRWRQAGSEFKASQDKVRKNLF